MSETTLIGRLLASAGAIAAGTSAYSDIVYFENPPPGEKGHYDWHWEIPPWAMWLDITRPSDAQLNIPGPTSVGQLSFSTFYYSNYTSGGAEVARYPRYGYRYGYTRAFIYGESINGTADWNHFSVHVQEFSYKKYSNFEEGVRAYIGVRTGSGNYGWIAVERDSFNLTAFGWAYETDPGVPIRAGQIPAPGTLAALAFGAVLPSGRRRKG